MPKENPAAEARAPVVSQSFVVALEKAQKQNSHDGRIVRLVTSSPNTAAFHSLMTSVREGYLKGLGCQVVLTGREPRRDARKLLGELARAFETQGVAGQLRKHTIGRIRHAFDFMQVGKDNLWISEDLNGSLELAHVAKDDPANSENQDATALFDFIWAMSDELNLNDRVVSTQPVPQKHEAAA